jgi:hypothetical protein
MADIKNTTPSSRSLRSEIRTQISEWDVRILALEDTLATARRERENLRLLLDDYKYPVLTLPIEITSEIFISIFPEYPECSPMTGLHSPALLGQVCRTWRDIAFNTPRLWRAFELHLWNEDSFDAQLTVLKSWLSRSKDYSLSLHLQLATFSELAHFTDTLLSHSARWEQIILYCPCSELDWIKGKFPQLRQLTLATYGRRFGQRPKTLFDNAPRLTSVVLGESFVPDDVVLPWSQLTSIDAVQIAPIAAVAILRQATALVSLRCALWASIVIPEALPPLLHLRSLIIRDGAKNWPESPTNPQKFLLDSLTTPALRHLSISEYDLGAEPISTITSLLSRSHCALDALHITNSSLSEADYRVLFPSIKIIDISTLDGDESEEENEENEGSGYDDD